MNANPAHPRLRRLAAGLGVALIVLAAASPAAAHGGGDEPGPANFRSEIIEPGVDGLSWRVLDGDGAIELTNTTGADVVVVGYQGEPYLRFAVDGVYRNVNSLATYLNEDRYGEQRTADPGDPVVALPTEP